MGRHWRWAVVAGVTSVLIALPFGVTLLPAGSSSITAAALLREIQSSQRVAYSGYAQSRGGLSIPLETRGFSLGDLLGGITQLRVWWRASTDWRVDTVSAAGESDLHQDGTDLWTWDYESSTAQLDPGPRAVVARLPRPDDLLPASLARRLLSQASVSQVSRLPNARVAGQQAAGLRMTVGDKRSTIDHVDVWAVASNGLPLRVAAFGSSGAEVVSSSMLDVSIRQPSAALTRFVPPANAHLRDDSFGDIVSAIDELGDNTPPASIAGLPRTDARIGSVGVYGRGVTLLIAVPMTPRLTRYVEDQVRSAPGVVQNSAGISLASGPLHLQLSPPGEFGARWLLVGTVTAKTLRAAVPGLPRAQGFGFGR